MNVIFAIIGIVIGVVVVINLIKIRKGLSKQDNWVRVSKGGDRMGEESLREMVEIMRERRSRERDEELAKYAESRYKNQPILNPLPVVNSDGKIHTSNKKADKILIPENLSEEEKETLRAFYNL